MGKTTKTMKVALLLVAAAIAITSAEMEHPNGAIVPEATVEELSNNNAVQQLRQEIAKLHADLNAKHAEHATEIAKLQHGHTANLLQEIAKLQHGHTANLLQVKNLQSCCAKHNLQRMQQKGWGNKTRRRRAMRRRRARV